MVTESQVVEHIKAQVAKSTAAQVAREVGVTRAYLGDIIHGRRHVSRKIANAFGYEYIVVAQIINFKEKVS
jgi:plasmid maintenance system antidote protein VapI